MPGLTVFVQRRSETVLRVLGVAFDRGWPEPITIESVRVSVDGGGRVDATLGPGYRDGRMLAAVPTAWCSACSCGPAYSEEKAK